MPPRARNGPSARCILRARRPLLGSIAISAGMTTETRPTTIATMTTLPEEEPEHEHELDVPHAHARGREQRGDEQEQPAREGRERELGQIGGVEHRREHDAAMRRAAA